MDDEDYETFSFKRLNYEINRKKLIIAFHPPKNIHLSPFFCSHRDVGNRQQTDMNDDFHCAFILARCCAKLMM